MKVILLQDLDNLGEEGEVVSVKDGYGRNYLIPQGLAYLATPGAIKAHEEERRQAARKRAVAKEEAEAVAKELESMEVVVTARVGEENRIFGTVTSQQIAVELSQRGFDIDRRNIELNEDIRLIGVYTATVKVQSGVSAQLKIRVIPDSGNFEV